MAPPGSRLLALARAASRCFALARVGPRLLPRAGPRKLALARAGPCWPAIARSSARLRNGLLACPPPTFDCDRWRVVNRARSSVATHTRKWQTRRDGCPKLRKQSASNAGRLAANRSKPSLPNRNKTTVATDQQPHGNIATRPRRCMDSE